jgi:hypothetical protein
VTERAHELAAAADGQLTELIDLISTLEHAGLSRPCPGREKLGDGTIGAALRHTADNYHRIAGFVETSDRMAATHQPARHGGHRVPRFLRAFGHRSQDHSPRDHTAHDHDANQRDTTYTADINTDAVVEQLKTSRSAMSRIAHLTDTQLDAIPPKDSFRFCDGQRTLEQVLSGLFKHQGHQIDAVKTALA